MARIVKLFRIEQEIWDKLEARSGKRAIDICTPFTRTNRRRTDTFCSACRTDGNGCGSRNRN